MPRHVVVVCPLSVQGHVTPLSSIRWRAGIQVRIALLAWLVTILTLLVFIAVILPLQKRTFLQNLESKAYGISISVQDAVADALATNDQRSVMDHCTEVLNGDRSIDFIVLTRGDGFGLVLEREARRVENLGEVWHPARRAESAGIERSALFDRRVFRYARPVDLSGREWGWMHVGLSLQSYDQSVRDVYRRTLVLGVICVILGGLTSLLYANQLVRPIRTLQAAVQRVAKGDLSVRAEVHSGDEVENLAQSFNVMTDALLQRNRILESVRFAAKEFLTEHDWTSALERVLARLGEAAQVSRAFVFQNQVEQDGNLTCRPTQEWVAPGVEPRLHAPELQEIRWHGAGLEEWAGLLKSGQIAAAHVRELGVIERGIIHPSVQSFILMPVMVRGEWWGFLGFDQADREREWSEVDQDSFRAVSDILGAAIERQRAQDALVEAKSTLEARVRERTRELVEQVKAEERARKDLGEAQQRLMDMSRQAGMAEVATGVLHNIGNVLNSVNVSATLVADRLKDSRLGKLAAVTATLQENLADLPAFLHHDPRGQRLVPYLVRLVEHLQEEQVTLLKELESLTKNVEHIKGIVSVQQNYAKVSGIQENLSLADLVEDAIQITQAGLDRHDIHLHREFEPMPLVQGDKHKILQILLNLIRNAKQAIRASENAARDLRLRIRRQGEGRVQIQVQDSGMGVRPEHLTRIFSHGFTTKRDGHGFGLHHGALAARQMGGSLWAESAGLGKGATFTLELPLQPSAEAGAST